MKLYDCATAPNPRRVRIFLAEKNLTIPVVQVDLRAGEHLKPDYAAINPSKTVPVLELDDGTRISESVAICRYLEDSFPEPPLMGVGAKERALVEMWNRRMEHDGLFAAGEALRNAAPGLKGRALAGVDEPVEQIPALAERGRASMARFMRRLDQRLAESRFIAGDKFSIADITAFCAIDFARWAKITPPEDLTHLARWRAAIAARPSAQA